MELLLMGLITFFDFAVLKWKWGRARYGDFILDLGMLTLVIMFFHGSMTTMLVGMIAQFLMSLYLIVSPPKFLMPTKAP